MERGVLCEELEDDGQFFIAEIAEFGYVVDEVQGFGHG